MDACAAACPARRQRLRPDHRGAPTAARVILPANVRVVCSPPSCPALNPMERVGRDLKEALAGLHGAHLEGQHDYVAERLRTSEQATRQALTGDPSLVEAIHALGA